MRTLTIPLSVITTVLAFVLLASAASATQPPDHKVGLCHRTASDTNPYVYIEVDEASLDAHLNNLPGHPAKTNADGSPRNDYLANDAEDCVIAQPTASPELTSTPAPTETPAPTLTPAPTPSASIEPLPDTAMRPEDARLALIVVGVFSMAVGVLLLVDAAISKLRR